MEVRGDLMNARVSFQVSIGRIASPLAEFSLMGGSGWRIEDVVPFE